MPSNKLNLAFYFFGIIVSGALSFLFIPVVVQLYGKETYGTFSLISNTLSVIAMFCYAWIGQSFIRFYDAEKNEIFNTSKRLLLKSLVIGGVIFSVVLSFFGNVSIISCLLLIVTFFLFGYYCFMQLAFQTFRKAKDIMICEVIRTSTNLILAILFITCFDAKNKIEYLVLSMLISYLIPSSILFFKHKKKIKFVISKTETSTVKDFLNFGIPIALFLSGSLALAVNDRFLISSLINEETAGIYSAIYDVINKGVTAVFSPILMTFYPVVTEMYNKGKKEEAFQEIRKLILVEIVLLICGLIVLYFLSSFLLLIIFKNPMPQEFEIITILIFLGVCLWQIAMLVHKKLELRQETKYMAKAVFVALFVNVLCNVIILNKSSNLIFPAITTLIGTLVYIFMVINSSKADSSRNFAS